METRQTKRAGRHYMKRVKGVLDESNYKKRRDYQSKQFEQLFQGEVVKLNGKPRTKLTKRLLKRLGQPVSVLEPYLPESLVVRMLAVFSAMSVETIEQLLNQSFTQIMEQRNWGLENMEHMYVALEKIGFVRYNKKCK